MLPPPGHNRSGGHEKNHTTRTTCCLPQDIFTPWAPHNQYEWLGGKSVMLRTHNIRFFYFCPPPPCPPLFPDILAFRHSALLGYTQRNICWLVTTILYISQSMYCTVRCHAIFFILILLIPLRVLRNKMKI